MTDDELIRYSRHILLNEWGIQAQQLISKARALVIGLGGLGCPVAHQLAAAGVGHITLVDDDVVDASNLQRQYLHKTTSIGQAKVVSAMRALQDINPYCTVEALNTRLSGGALEDVVQRHDVVLDCTDSFDSRHEINRACVAQLKPLFSGAATRFDGQWVVFDAAQAASPCYHCIFPELPHQPLQQDNCATMGVFAPLTMYVGTMQAMLALHYLGKVAPVKIGQLHFYNAFTGAGHSIMVQKNAQCPVCGVNFDSKR